MAKTFNAIGAPAGHESWSLAGKCRVCCCGYDAEDSKDLAGHHQLVDLVANHGQLIDVAFCERALIALSRTTESKTWVDLGMSGKVQVTVDRTSTTALARRSFELCNSVAEAA